MPPGRSPQASQIAQSTKRKPTGDLAVFFVLELDYTEEINRHDVCHDWRDRAGWGDPADGTGRIVTTRPGLAATPPRRARTGDRRGPGRGAFPRSSPLRRAGRARATSPRSGVDALRPGRHATGERSAAPDARGDRLGRRLTTEEYGSHRRARREDER